MGNALSAIASVLGGGAEGAVSGLSWIDKSRDDERNFQARQSQLGTEHQDRVNQLVLERDQLTHQMTVAKDVETHRQLEERRLAIDQMIRSISGANINLANPSKAYDYSQQHPEALSALMTAAGPASQNAAKFNRPYEPITGDAADQLGGAGFDNKTYNPFTATNATGRVGAQNLATKTHAVQAATAAVETSRRNAETSYSSNPDTASLLKSIDPTMAAKARANMETFSKGEAQKRAAAELNNLKVLFRGDPDIEGMTEEDLLGMPAVRSAPPPNANPLGLPPARPTGPPAGGAPPAAPANQADPLGFGTPRPGAVSPTVRPPNADPLGIIRRPPGF